MIYPDFDELLRLGYYAEKLDMVSARPVLSIVSGDHRSPFRGRGLEFEEVREYVHGDDVRNIDWRVTARTGRPHLKLFSEERERSVFICTDVNLSMRFGTRGTFKSIQAARATALLGWSANKGNNRIGGSFFGNVPNGMQFYDATRSRKALWRMLKQLCSQEIYQQEPVTLEHHLRYLANAVPAGSLVFIISDFLHVTEGLKKRLADLHRHSDIVLVSINDPADEIIPSVGTALFQSGDDKRLRVDTNNKLGQKSYRQYWQDNRKMLAQMTRSLGIPSIALRTDGDVGADLVRAIKLMKRKGGNGFYGQRSAFATA